MFEERPPTVDVQPEREFRALAAEWSRDTGHLSTMADILLHPAHFRIVGLGGKALPLILKEAAKRKGYWFTVLAAITGESVASDEMSYDQAVDAWLAWGVSKGYLDVRS